MPDSALPAGLRGKKHTDWPWPFSGIPRGWTAFKWGSPKQILGNQEDKRLDPETGRWAPKPIGAARSWQVSYYPGAPWWAFSFNWYLAFSGKRGADGKFRHYRLGTRFEGGRSRHRPDREGRSQTPPGS